MIKIRNVSNIWICFGFRISDFGFLQSVHGFENLLVLDLDLHAYFLADLFQSLSNGPDVLRRFLDVNQHGHDKNAVHDGLHDILDVYVELKKGRGDIGYDSGPVLSNDGDDGEVLVFAKLFFRFHIFILPKNPNFSLTQTRSTIFVAKKS